MKRMAIFLVILLCAGLLLSFANAAPSLCPTPTPTQPNAVVLTEPEASNATGLLLLPLAIVLGFLGGIIGRRLA